jgi:NUMOD4 motif/HNH endonuclease
MENQLELIAPEHWRPVVGYEGYYDVSDHGRVRRVARANCTWPGRLLRPSPEAGGYLGVRLSRHNQKRSCRVHQLVLRAFVGPPLPGQDVHHRSGNKHDNRLVNLTYVTKAENTRHAFRTGLVRVGSPRLKLTATQVHAIRAAAREGVRRRDLAREFGVTKHAIRYVIRRQTWRWLA